MKTKRLFIVLGILIILTSLLIGCSNNSKEVNSNTYSVSGTISDKNGIGLEGVQIHFSGNHGIASTDSEGNWYKSGLSGRVTITPVDENYIFSPENRTVTSKATGLNFEASDNLPAPIILHIPKVSTNTAELNWTEIEEASSYEIYRSIDNVDYRKINVIESTSYIDNELEVDKKYYFRIKAISVDKALESNLSEYMVIKTPSVGEMTIDKNVIVFSEEQMNRIFLEKIDNEVILKKNPKTSLLEEGNMIFSEYSRHLDIFLNHKIVSIEKTEQNIILTLEEIDIEEIVDMVGDATFSQSIDNTISLDAIKEHQSEIASLIKQDLNLPGKVKVSINMVGSNLELKITHLPLNFPIIEESITLYVDNGFETIFNRNRWFLQIDTGFRIKYDFGIGTPYNSDLWLSVLEKEELGKRWTVAEIPLVKSVFWIGVVPTYISLDLPVEVFLNGEIKGSAHLGYETPKFIQSAGFNINWNNLSKSNLIYEWNKVNTNSTGAYAGFLFEGTLNIGLSESFTLSIWTRELLKGGIEQYLSTKLSYEAAREGLSTAAKGKLDKSINIDAKLGPGKDAEKILKGLSNEDFSYNINLFTLDLGTIENKGPTLKVDQKEGEYYLSWNQPYVFTFIGSVETINYNILRKENDTDNWKLYKTILDSSSVVISQIEESGYYKVVPLIYFFGVYYPGLESNTVKLNSPPEIDIIERTNNLTVLLIGCVTDDEKVELVNIDWGDDSNSTIRDNFENIVISHTYARKGMYTISIEAEDNLGDSTKEYIIVHPHSNQPPVINLVETINERTVTLTGNVTDDVMVSEVTIDWGDGENDKINTGFNDICISHTYKSSSPSIASFVSNSRNTETYTINIIATDNEGLSSFETIIVNLQEANHPPQIDIIESIDAMTVTLTGSVTDTDGEVCQVIIDWGDGINENVNSEFDNIDLSHNYSDSETYNISIKAVDNEGAESIQNIEVILSNRKYVYQLGKIGEYENTIIAEGYIEDGVKVGLWIYYKAGSFGFDWSEDQNDHPDVFENLTETALYKVRLLQYVDGRNVSNDYQTFSQIDLGGVLKRIISMMGYTYYYFNGELINEDPCLYFNLPSYEDYVVEYFNLLDIPTDPEEIYLP